MELKHALDSIMNHPEFRDEEFTNIIFNFMQELHRMKIDNFEKIQVIATIILTWSQGNLELSRLFCDTIKSLFDARQEDADKFFKKHMEEKEENED